MTYRFGVLYKDLSKFSGTILGASKFKGNSKALATPPKFNLFERCIWGLGFLCLFAFPFRSNFLWGAACGVLPSLKLTARTRKWKVGILSRFLLGPGRFSGALAVSFREGTVYDMD